MSSWGVGLSQLGTSLGIAQGINMGAAAMDRLVTDREEHAVAGRGGGRGTDQDW